MLCVVYSTSVDGGECVWDVGVLVLCVFHINMKQLVLSTSKEMGIYGHLSHWCKCKQILYPCVPVNSDLLIWTSEQCSIDYSYSILLYIYIASLHGLVKFWFVSISGPILRNGPGAVCVTLTLAHSSTAGLCPAAFTMSQLNQCLLTPSVPAPPALLINLPVLKATLCANSEVLSATGAHFQNQGLCITLLKSICKDWAWIGKVLIHKSSLYCMGYLT